MFHDAALYVCNRQIVAVALWATRTLPAGKRLQCLPVASSGFLEQFSKPARCLITSNLARGDIENELFPIVNRQFAVQQKTVLLHEDKTGSERGAFVSIKERMIAGNVEQICRCDLMRIGYEGLAHHRCLRRRHG